MAPILPPPPPERRFSRVAHIFSPFDGSRTEGRENAEGAIYSIRFRVVCRECNSGWMNEIETEARPYLTALVTGEPITLDSNALKIVAQWIALKIMVAEHGEPNSAVTPRPYRLRFRQTRAIPDFMKIYVASHDLPFDKSVGYRRDSQCIALNGPRLSPPLGDVSNNIQSVLFFIGRVFVYVTSARIDNLNVEDIALIPSLYDTARIWPPMNGESMSWPREPRFNLKQIRSITEAMRSAIERQNRYWAKRSDIEQD